MDFRDAPAAQSAVQFPRCPATVSVSGAGQYRIQMRIPPSSQLMCDFHDYLDASDAAAVSRTLDLTGGDDDGGGGAPQVSSTVYDPDPGYRDPSARMTAFAGSCTFFDAHGVVTHDPVGTWDVACIAALDGTWHSATRVGVRWKVSQVKLYPRSLKRPRPVVHAPTAAAACLFLDDDDSEMPASQPASQYAFIE
jgi:hypothetical protein